jgi:hypothetical protein
VTVEGAADAIEFCSRDAPRKQNFSALMTDHIEDDASGSRASRSHCRIQKKTRVVSVDVACYEWIKRKTPECRIDTCYGKDSPRAEGFHHVPDELRVTNNEKFDGFREGRGQVREYLKRIGKSKLR